MWHPALTSILIGLLAFSVYAAGGRPVDGPFLRAAQAPIDEAFDSVTHVYHCAAKISFNPAQYKTLRKTNIEGTATVVNLCLLNNVQKLCYVSSIATLSENPANSHIDENAEWNPENPNSVYAITKYGAESNGTNAQKFYDFVFSEKARELLPSMGSGDLLELAIDGLRKAGLDIKSRQEP